MSAQESAYPLAEPSPVEVTSIESQLEEIWRSCAEAEGNNAVMRAAAFTLIFAARGTAQDLSIQDTLVQLTLRHPVRAILLCLTAETDAHPLSAWVSVYCHRPSPSSSPVCSDLITLEAAGQDCSAIVSTLLALLLSGLPTVLIWDNSLPTDHPVLLRLGSQLERVIVSAIPPCSPASRLSALFKLKASLGAKPVVTDLAECLLLPWQSDIARLFDREPDAANRIHEIRISFAGDKIPSEMLLLAAWLSVVLKWTAQRITLHGHSPGILFAEDRMISFISQTDLSAKDHLEFHLNSPDGEAILRCEEPPGENRLTELLHLQLQIWGRDPVRGESLHRARLWLKELLFS